MFNRRRRDIEEFCNQRGIERLVHFTQAANLPSILGHGLLSRDELEKLGIISDVGINDVERYDCCKNAICMSISFPNYRMFFPIRQDNETDWAVIEIDPSVLWESDCAFCKTNAADSSVRHIPIENRKAFTSLSALFEDSFGVTRAELAIPSYYPTNPQAEILVFNPILRVLMRNIAFESNELFKEYEPLLKDMVFHHLLIEVY